MLTERQRKRERRLSAITLLLIFVILPCLMILSVETIGYGWTMLAVIVGGGLFTGAIAYSGTGGSWDTQL